MTMLPGDDGAGSQPWAEPGSSVRRLIAGALGPERQAYRRDPEEPRWYEPLHVRAPAIARDAMARSIAVGADVLVAPTWLTHRRALLPTGETRRAAAWTDAAVRVAREAVEGGLEMRERATREAASRAGEVDLAGGESGVRHGGEAAVPRPPVWVAGVVPSLGDIAEAGSGRLAARDAGRERDLRAAAGLIAEAGADLLIMEGGADLAGARAALAAAVETGLPAWVTAPVGGSSGADQRERLPIEAWATALAAAGAHGLLLLPLPGADPAAALGRVHATGVSRLMTGILAAPPWQGPDATVSDGARDAAPHRDEAVAVGWLEAGAGCLGMLDGATPERLASLRAAIDRVDGARLAARAAVRARWTALVGEAARRAPGGRAAWIGPRDPSLSLPAGFAWTVVGEAPQALPAGAFQLVVATGARPTHRLAALLEPGGIVLARDTDPLSAVAAGLRPIEVVAEPAALIARRDP